MNQVSVGSSSEVTEGKVLAAKAGGQSVIVTRAGGKLCAYSAKCPHLGLPLGKGKVAGGAITCPFHGSRFDLATGENLDWVNSFAGLPLPTWSHGMLSMGKKPAPLKAFEVCEKDGAVLVTVP